MEKSCPVFNSIKSKNVTLTVTQKCNLACLYCYEHSKEGHDMDLETAQKIINDEENANDQSESITFDFFGGEPFMNFDLIKGCIEYYKSRTHIKPIRFFLSTNGTLVHGEIQKWLLENKSILTCGLSLDGNREVHNHNRSNSYDSIDLDFFINTYPLQPIKMTIHPDKIEKLSESIIECHNMGFHVSCNLAYGVDWSSDITFCAFEKQLDILVDYYISNPDITPCSMLDRNIYILGSESNSTHVQKWCGIKTNMHTYDTNGVQYPCQFFLPMSCGYDKSITFSQFHIDENIPIEKLDDECQKCLFSTLCPSCYGSNYLCTGNMYHRDMNMCRYTKLQLKACSYIQAIKYCNGDLKLETSKQSYFAKAILKLLTHDNKFE